MALAITYEQARALAEDLRQRGLAAVVLDPVAGSDTVGVNVWTDPTARFPDDTVWFYDANPAVTWGPNFEHTANAGDPSLVQRVLETLGR